MALSSLSGFRPNPPLGPVGAENPILWVPKMSSTPLARAFPEVLCRRNNVGNRSQ
jgi:hypothetical protein